MKQLSLPFLLIFSLTVLLFTACKDEEGDDPQPDMLSISALDPTSGAAGDTLTITGSNFGSNPTVTIGDSTASVVGSASSSSVKVTVPMLAAGSYNVKVSSGEQSATAADQFTVTEGSGAEETRIDITDADLEAGQEYNWTADKEYYLTGLVYLEEGGILNIEQGTVVRFTETTGDDNTSALVIARGAQIFAEGTAQEPIIFTAEADTANAGLTPTTNQLWGGLIVLGNAPVSLDGVTQNISIEGIDSDETRATYGGNDPADNSGVLKYVSIRYTGVGLAPNSEIQGLTLGGVGNGTTIDYVDIYASSDDGVEIFGGTVNLSHLSVAWATDDALDYDLGWRGNAQFVFAIQLEGDKNVYDKVGEWDGADPDDAALFSAPNVYNATLVGPGQTSTGSQLALIMRDAFAGKLANSILEDFPGVGIEVEDIPGDVDSYARISNAVDGYQVEVLNNTWAQFGGATDLESLVQATVIEDDPATAENEGFTGEKAAVVAELTDNANIYSADAVLGSISRAEDGGLDPRPATADASVATVPEGMEQVNYRGAFEPGQATWLSGWSTLSQLGFLVD